MHLTCRESRGRYLNFASWLTTSSVLAGCQVLPEQCVVNVSTAVEVNQWLQRNCRGNILLCLCSLNLFEGGVVAVDIGLVVVLVVQLHDLAGDGGLECAIVVCKQ